MKRYEYPQLDERIYRETLSNGLTLMVVPKPGFSRKIAYFATDFGAMHRNFTFEGREYEMPMGIAHFLEHKLFDMPGGRDVMAEFAAWGANANAFTSYDLTAYYFSCTENFADCLDLLLEFVSTPCFTEESVRKELGIIDQEIGMSDDDPDRCVYEDLIRAAYTSHPIRLPILGTRESIRRITPELLYTCHRAFYTPGNMILCVVGDVDPEQVRTMALERLGPEPGEVGRKLRDWDEPLTCTAGTVTRNMKIAMPTFNLLFKASPVEPGEQGCLREIAGDFASELLFGESSELYQRLYEEGVIDTAFGGGFEDIDGCAMLMISGDSYDPERVREEIIAQAEKLCREGIPEADFLRLKRSALGGRIKSLDSFDATCFRLCVYHFLRFDYFSFPRLYEQISREDVLQFLAEVVRRESSALSVIYPYCQEDQS